ncbi:MAG: DUF3090 family protein [Chloroflexi bacterium]|nr:DUF3090 family protein [Chloroflexota bacterium]
MPRRILVFDLPDRFAAGAIGRPGQRTFFLQAVQGRRLAAVVLEKVQVALLADRIIAIIAELRSREVPGVPAADDTRSPNDDDRPLDEPIGEAFRVATLTISWDGEAADITVEARSAYGDEDDEDEDDIADDAPEGPDVLRVTLDAAAALGFARRAARIVAAGRPPCPFCGEPLNLEGHVCARTNGYLN